MRLLFRGKAALATINTESQSCSLFMSNINLHLLIGLPLGLRQQSRGRTISDGNGKHRNMEGNTFEKKNTLKLVKIALHLSGISFEEWACLSACSGWVLPPQQFKSMKKVHLWGCV